MTTIHKFIALLIVVFSVFSYAQKSGLKKDLTTIIKGKQATVAVSVLSLDDHFV